MQLKKHLEHTKKCIINLFTQPYILEFLSSKIDEKEINEQCYFIIEEINTILFLNNDEIHNDYSKYSEFSYYAQDFFEKISEEASLFASQQICNIITGKQQDIYKNNYFSSSNNISQEISSIDKNTNKVIIVEGPNFENLDDNTLSNNIINSLSDITSILYEILQQHKFLELSLINEIEEILIHLEKINSMKKNGDIISDSIKINVLALMERVGVIFLHQDVEKILLNIKKL